MLLRTFKDTTIPPPLSFVPKHSIKVGGGGGDSALFFCLIFCLSFPTKEEKGGKGKEN